MSAAAVQALVVLALLPPATVLLHLGIARDARRWEAEQRRAALAERMQRISRSFDRDIAAFRAMARAGIEVSAASHRLAEVMRRIGGVA
jgi:hypothetical protein